MNNKEDIFELGVDAGIRENQLQHKDTVDVVEDKIKDILANCEELLEILEELKE